MSPIGAGRVQGKLLPAGMPRLAPAAARCCSSGGCSCAGTPEGAGRTQQGISAAQNSVGLCQRFHSLALISGVSYNLPAHRSTLIMVFRASDPPGRGLAEAAAVGPWPPCGQGTAISPRSQHWLCPATASRELQTGLATPAVPLHPLLALC